MQLFDYSGILVEREKLNRPWLEFLRVPALSMGVYHLKAGEADRQQPHTEDEVYYVVRGRARFRAGDQTQPVRPGTLIYVEKQVVHRFFDITEDLTALVFFAPAEGTATAAVGT